MKPSPDSSGPNPNAPEDPHRTWGDKLPRSQAMRKPGKQSLRSAVRSVGSARGKRKSSRA